MKTIHKKCSENALPGEQSWKHWSFKNTIYFFWNAWLIWQENRGISQRQKYRPNQEIFNAEEYLKAKAIVCFNDLCPSLVTQEILIDTFNGEVNPECQEEL